MENRFRTIVPIAQSTNKIDFKTPVLMLGSCFSDNIGELLREDKFPTISNPFGVLYNPLSIAQVLKNSINNTPVCDDDLIFHNNLWHSFLTHSSFSSENKEETINNFHKKTNLTHHTLKNAEYLIITLGTAWIYRNKTNNKIVANCHKLPANYFFRERLTISQIKNEWNEVIKELKSINKNIKIIFTVSPVRHLKDGFHDNQISKSTLLLAIDEIISSTSNAEYFPSYEIINDELRDYRFYSEDMTHISSQSVNYIYQRFKETYFSKDTSRLIKHIEKIVKAKNHKPLTNNPHEIEKFSISMLTKINSLIQNYPFINLETEKTYFENLKSEAIHHLKQ